MDIEAPQHCPTCGRPDSAPSEIVSRHVTSEGVIVYSRCLCGRLQVRRGSGVVVRSRRAAVEARVPDPCSQAS